MTDIKTKIAPGTQVLVVSYSQVRDVHFKTLRSFTMWKVSASVFKADVSVDRGGFVTVEVSNEDTITAREAADAIGVFVGKQVTGPRSSVMSANRMGHRVKWDVTDVASVPA